MKTDDQLFDEAFDEATGTKPGAASNGGAEGGDGASTVAASTDSATGEGAAANEGSGSSEPAAAPAPAAAASAPAAPAPAPAPAATQLSEDDDPVKLRAKISTLQGIAASQGSELKELRQKVATPAPAAPAPAPKPADAGEDDELIAELEEASPTLVKAVRSLLKKERGELQSEFEKRVDAKVAELTGQIAPLRQSAETQAVQSHYAAIESAHPKWESDVASPQFAAWAQSQPSYVQRELKRVAEQGTAQEVIEVLDSYRKANPATTEQTQAQAPGNEKRAQQQAALGTVKTRPAASTTRGVNKDDFDGAFEEAIAAAAAAQ